MKINHCNLTDNTFSAKLESARNFLTAISVNLAITDNGSYLTPKKAEISNFFILP